MEPGILAEKQVLFHGMWKAGYRVSDNLIKSIGNDVASKPSRPCILRLTSDGLTLELLPSAEGKSRKTDQVSFDSLRDIFVNHQQSKCLIIIYVDSNNTFSVMACSSQEEKDLQDLSKAFKDHKNVLLKNLRSETALPASANWTLRQSARIPSDGKSRLVQESYVKSNASNGVAFVGRSVTNVTALPREQYGSSLRSNVSSRRVSDSEHNEDDEFLYSRPVVVHEPEVVVRELASSNLDGRPEAFNVGIQTAPYDEEYDSESITSAMSLQSSKQDLLPGSEDCTSPVEKSAGISAEVFHRRTVTHGNRTIIELNSLPKDKDDDTHNEGLLVGSDKEYTNGDHHADDSDRHNQLTNGTDNGNEKNDDQRSLGTQTDNNSKIMRRYAKNQVTRQSSNPYVEKAAAVKKKISSTGPKSSSPGGIKPVVKSNVTPASSGPSVVSAGSQQRGSVGQSSSVSQPMKRTMSIGRTSVIKPIESVYLGRSARRSNSARNHRSIIIYTPTAANRMM